MPEHVYLREKAQHCRNLTKIATSPDLRVQLLKFAEEFDHEADKLDPVMAEDAADRR